MRAPSVNNDESKRNENINDHKIQNSCPVCIDIFDDSWLHFEANNEDINVSPIGAFKPQNQQPSKT